MRRPNTGLASLPGTPAAPSGVGGAARRVPGRPTTSLGSFDGEPGVHATLRFDDGRMFEGMNFGSQDYLGLSTDERVREAGIRAIRDFGVHSASSGMLQGGTRPSLELEAELGDFVSAEHVTLFPTGWGAGFGTITALVRPTDHIIMDRLAHVCLQQGAHAATQNIQRYRHLDVEEATAHIARVRAGDARSGILVITEGTFSMDADAPRLRSLVAACREYEATLFVDVAHDLGQLGPGGTGQLGLQEVLGEVDLVMGAFSKTFCSCGGFIASRAASVKDYVRVFGGTFAFSNALSAAQAAVALEAVRITRSADGDARRAELQRAAITAERVRGHAARRGNRKSASTLTRLSQLSRSAMTAKLLARRPHRRGSGSRGRVALAP
jgi:glycine C-acetyltransferase